MSAQPEELRRQMGGMNGLLPHSSWPPISSPASSSGDDRVDDADQDEQRVEFKLSKLFNSSGQDYCVPFPSCQHLHYLSIKKIMPSFQFRQAIYFGKSRSRRYGISAIATRSSSTMVSEVG